LKKRVTYRNREYIFEILPNGDLSIDGEIFSTTVDQEINSVYKVTVNDQTFTVEVSSKDFIIDGENVDISIKPFIPKRVINNGSQKKKKINLKAPIPGKIAQILVKEGDTVDKNQELMILEAMKMRNRIFSPDKGKVKKICVKENSIVEQDQKLLEFETFSN